MKPKLHYAALEAKTVALRANIVSFGSGVEVDEVAGTIKNAAVMTIGEASGHGFSIDAKTLEQVSSLINEAGPAGLKMRFKHPEENEDGRLPDDLGTDVGFIKNARIKGDSVRGDIYLADYASHLPGQGDVRTYLLKKAKSNPDGFGLSAVIGFDPEPVVDAAGELVGLVARVFEVQAVDFVGKPAANPRGLLSDKQTKSAVGTLPAKSEPAGSVACKSLSQRKINMNSKLKALLCSKHGLAEGASDEEAQQKYDELSDELKAELSAALEAGEEVAEEKKPEPSAAMSAKGKPQPRQAILVDEGDKLLAMEGKRVAQVQQLGNMLKIAPEVVALAVAENETVVEAKARFLKHLSDSAKPIMSVKVGEDRNRASLAAAIPDAIRIRAGIIVKNPSERSTALATQSVLDMYRTYLVALGVPADRAMGYGKVRLAELLGPRRFRQEFPQFASLAQSTSDFDSILENTMRKTLRAMYQEYPATWSRWAQRATTPDFKPVSRPQLGQAADLQPRNEGGEVKYATIADGKETYTLVEHTGGIRLTRQALINDDLSVFNRIPKIQGQAAKRLEDQLAYNVLSRNAALVDTVALFHGTHANLVSATAGIGSPSTVTILDHTNKLMRKQTGLGGRGKLNLSAKYLLVPTALEIVATQFISSTVDPSKNNQTPNPFSGKMEVIASPFLDAGNSIPGSDSTTGSDTAWYLASDMIETVEVCFLSDEPEPVLRQETDFDTEDVKFAVRHTVAAAAVEFRGMVKNPGA